MATDHTTLAKNQRLIKFNRNELVVTEDSIPELIRLLALSIRPHLPGESGVMAYVKDNHLSVEWNGYAKDSDC